MPLWISPRARPFSSPLHVMLTSYKSEVIVEVVALVLQLAIWGGHLALIDGASKEGGLA